MRALKTSELKAVTGGDIIPLTDLSDPNDLYWAQQNGSIGDGSMTTGSDGLTTITWDAISATITVEADTEGYFDLNNNGVDDDGASTSDGVDGLVIVYSNPFGIVDAFSAAQYVNSVFRPTGTPV